METLLFAFWSYVANSAGCIKKTETEKKSTILFSSGSRVLVVFSHFCGVKVKYLYKVNLYTNQP